MFIIAAGEQRVQMHGEGGVTWWRERLQRKIHQQTGGGTQCEEYALKGHLAAKIEGMQMAAIRPTARAAWEHGNATSAMVGDGLESNS